MKFNIILNLRKASWLLLGLACFNIFLVIVFYQLTNDVGLFALGKYHALWIPPFTSFVISIPGGAIYIIAISLITLLIMKEVFISDKSIAININLAAIILSFLCLVIYIFGLVLPIIIA